MNDIHRTGYVNFLFVRRELVNYNAPRHRNLFVLQQSIVERHDDIHGLPSGQQIKLGDVSLGVVNPFGHRHSAFDFHITWHLKVELGGRGCRELNSHRLPCC